MKTVLVTALSLVPLCITPLFLWSALEFHPVSGKIWTMLLSLNKWNIGFSVAQVSYLSILKKSHYSDKWNVETL